MQSEGERGATPVPDLTNLDVYYEIGAELDLENIELLDDRAYRRLYAERMARWDEQWPIAPDRRFWPKISEASPDPLIAAATNGRGLIQVSP